MLPEIRVLLERAAMRRITLEGLLEVIPAEYWARGAPGGGWTIAQQVVHLQASDALVERLVDAVLGGEREVWLGGTRDEGELDRMRRGDISADQPGIADARQHLVTRLARLDAPHLEATVHVAGAVDRWGIPLGWSLREYLAAWAQHDSEHEASIRTALMGSPDLSTVALTRHRRN